MKKRLFALVLASVMLLGVIAACANDNAATPAAPAAPADPAAPAATGATREFVPIPAGDWDAPYDQTVLVTAVAPHGANWNFRDNDDVNDNPWTRLVKDRLNIEIHFDWTVPDDYPTRLNMAIAARELPDVFEIPNTADPRLFAQLQEQGMLLDMTDYYNNNASQRIRDHEKIDPDTIQGYTVDGRLFAVPRYYYGQIDSPWYMWVRDDWYTAEGRPALNTVADFENLAKAFMANHGASYGIATDNDLRWLFRTGPMFGVYVGTIAENSYFWRDDGTGRLKPDIAFPEFKTALEYWARWYDEGILSPEFMALDEWGRAMEDVYNGRVGIQPFWQWWGWAPGTTVAQDQGTDAVYYPYHIPLVDGGPARGQVPFPNIGGIVNNANFQNPAAFMKIISLYDWMVFSPDAGLTADDLFNYMDEGREHAMSSAFQVIDPNADYLQYRHVLHALDTGDESDLFTAGMLSKYHDSLRWINEKDPFALGPYMQMGSDRSSYARSAYLFDRDLIERTAMWGMAPAEFDQAGNTGDMIIEEVTQIIMGNRPVSDWDDILAEWYSRGGQIKEDAVNLHYGR